MPKEIEKKFLVKDQRFKSGADQILIQQGYLSTAKKRSVRVRIASNKALMTIKGKTKGAVRPEFEYEIPVEDARFILDKLCKKPLIEKYRYLIEYAGKQWEVDEFLGSNQGLIIAEIELEDEEQVFSKPPWIGEEVTGKKEYYNVNLVKRPFSEWEKPETAGTKH